MIIFESIIDGIRDIRDHFGRTMLQLVGIILGAASIVATFSLSTAGKSASMEFYRVSGGIQKMWVWNKPTGKVTMNAKALASKGLTYSDSLAIRRQAREIDLVAPMASQSTIVRAGRVEKTREISGVTPEYAPLTDFHAGSGRFLTDADVASAARVVVLGSERAQEFFGSDNPIGKTMTIGETGYTVVGVMEEKYFSFDMKRNVLRWMNRQIYVPVTTLITRRGETLEHGKIDRMQTRMKDVKRSSLSRRASSARLRSVRSRQTAIITALHARVTCERVISTGNSCPSRLRSSHSKVIAPPSRARRCASLSMSFDRVPSG